MMNVVALVGRLANDPEMKYTPAGMPIANFRLAVDRGRKNEAGENETYWLNIVCFQKTAELVAQYCDKGALVGIEGRIQSRSWEGNDGKKNYAVEIVANNVRFLESKAEAERRRAAKGGAVPQSREEAAARGVGGGSVSQAVDDPFSSE